MRELRPGPAQGRERRMRDHRQGAPEPGGNADAAPGGFADAKTAGGCCRGAEPLGGGSRRGSRKDHLGPFRHSG